MCMHVCTKKYGAGWAPYFLYAFTCMRVCIEEHGVRWALYFQCELHIFQCKCPYNVRDLKVCATQNIHHLLSHPSIVIWILPALPPGWLSSEYSLRYHSISPRLVDKVAPFLSLKYSSPGYCGIFSARRPAFNMRFKISLLCFILLVHGALALPVQLLDSSKTSAPYCLNLDVSILDILECYATVFDGIVSSSGLCRL